MNNIKILYNIFDEIEALKESTDFITNGFNIIFTKKEKNSSFESQNERVFNINMYILMRLFKEKIEKIKTEKGKFSINEYYDLIETLNLPNSIYKLYMEMPERIQKIRYYLMRLIFQVLWVLKETS